MTAAVAVAEYKSNIGPDFTLSDALDPDYLDVEERQRISADLAR